jgi:pyruvate dehydrogenase E2 component (dihydrolipoyllysine-residue acetyltransferase)
MSTTDLVMPKLGLTMTEGTISRWGVTPGSRFDTGDIIVVVETDKIAYDVEAPAPGILQEVLVGEGNPVPVGTPIGRWDIGDIEVPAPGPLARGVAGAPTIAESQPIPAAPPPRSDGQRILATPYARRLARQAGISLNDVEGSGPRGRIKAADVERMIAVGRAQKSSSEVAPAEEPRAAAYTAGVEIDVTALLALNDELKRQLPDLDAELVHYLIMALGRISDVFPNGPTIGLAPHPDHAGGMASVLATDDCRTLRAVMSRIAVSNITSATASLHGTVWIERALDGIAFLSGDPPPGWSAAISLGSVRHEFRPDAHGKPVRAAMVNLMLTCRAGEFDRGSAQNLLRRMRTLLERPLLLLAG